MGLEAASFLNDLVTTNPAGTDGKSQGDDHLRLLKTVLKATFPGMTAANSFDATTNNIVINSTDAGAGAGPIIDMYRNTTGAANDELGRIIFNGKDDGGAKQEFVNIHAAILDATAGSEDAEFVVDMVHAGTIRRFFAARADFAGFGPIDREDYFLGRNDDDGYLSFQGGNAVGDGSVRTYGGTHATKAKDIEFYSNNVLVYGYDFSSTQHEFNHQSYFAADIRGTNEGTSRPGNGSNAQGLHWINSTSAMAVNTNGDTSNFGRTADGTFMVWCSAGVAQGAVSIAGAVTTYSSFSGAHWAQFVDGTKPDLLPGTICDSLGVMSIWDNQFDKRLPRFEVSSKPKSPKVYGVFGWWDDFEAEKSNDAFIIGVGVYYVRMAPNENPKIGDYVEHGGGGMGRVQTEPYQMNSTVGKIISDVVAEVYEDGSKLYPASIHCS